VISNGICSKVISTEVKMTCQGFVFAITSQNVMWNGKNFVWDTCNFNVANYQGFKPIFSLEVKIASAKDITA